ncbi:minor capsid protein [Lactobacillus sp. CC-MHH1034]|uniref:minor capsid protein n=1 Tax=Agrilactobacillus fermenti TaxID=2586909 RepID=UPI001E46DE56|nr:minor capsid protein [Agrilactobacillus fermenti]MCD2255767.1 minor capsid protein [Agrilactobacillus fermenti]
MASNIHNEAYWKRREADEANFINDNIKTDEDFNKIIQKYYDDLIKSINDQINDEYLKYADRNNYTMTQARKKVTEQDVQAFSNRAKEIVTEAQKLYKEKGKVTYADFSNEINQQLRLYNATMRINRLELIKARIAQEVLATSIHVNQAFEAKLTGDYLSEIKRQSGILGQNIISPSTKSISKIVYAQTGGANFSQNLWNDDAVLRAKLNQALTQSIRQGLSPKSLADKLKPLVKNDVRNRTNVAERLARTESARVQAKAQVNSFKNNGYDYCKWIAEPSACSVCRNIADQKNFRGMVGVYKVSEVPYLPAHPNCRCSLSAWYTPLNDKEYAAITRYVSPDAYALNDTLRRGSKLTDAQNEWINNLDTALDKLPPYQTDKLYRSISLPNDQISEFVNQYIVGKEVDLSQYISTSKDVYDSNDTVRLVIKSSKTGRDISHWNPSESEVLFKRGTRFLVTNRYLSKDKHKPIIEVRVID